MVNMNSLKVFKNLNPRVQNEVPNKFGDQTFSLYIARIVFVLSLQITFQQ